MKKIYTSSYSLNGNSPNAIAISHVIPEYYGGATLSKVAPSSEILNKFRNDWFDNKPFDYKEAYLNLLQERGITAQGLIDEIPDGSVLLCYEPAGEFCHRRILAEWIEQETGMEIPETLEKHTELKNKQDKIVDSLIDF
jgi:hypothetical protein